MTQGVGYDPIMSSEPVCAVQTSLEEGGEGLYVLNGQKKWITCAFYAGDSTPGDRVGA